MNVQPTQLRKDAERKKKELVTEKHKQYDSIYIEGPQHIKQRYAIKVSTHMCKAIQKSEGMVDTSFKHSC